MFHSFLYVYQRVSSNFGTLTESQQQADLTRLAVAIDIHIEFPIKTAASFEPTYQTFFGCG